MLRVKGSWNRSRKRLSMAFLAGTVVLTQGIPFSVSYADTLFQDVPAGFWAAPAIYQLAAKGIISGKTKDQFFPNDPLTRAEFATLLVRSLNLPLENSSTPIFQDVGKDHWAFPYIQTAYKNHLVSGISQTKFGPDAQISRQDMAVMIINALKVGQVPDALLQSMLNYSDTAEIADYARKAVAASAFLGVMSGYPDGRFQPQENATRAAAASVINQMIQVPASKLQELNGSSASQPPQEEPKGSVEVFPSSVSLYAGSKQTFSATPLDPSGQVLDLPVKWSVSGNIGTIDEQGHFQASGSGTGKVTASVTYPDGTTLTSSADVTVKAGVKRVEVSPQEIQTTVGKTTPLTVKAYDSNGQLIDSPQVTWQVNGNIGSVQNGTFTANQAGSGSLVAAVTTGEASATAKVNVTVTAPTPQPAKQLVFSTVNYGTVMAGQPLVLTLNVKGSDGNIDTSDSGHAVTLTVNGPDGSQTLQGTTQNGVVKVQLSKSQVGTYTVSAAGSGYSLLAPATFVVQASAPVNLQNVNFHVAPSTFVKPLQQVTLRFSATDGNGNAVNNITFSVDSSRGTITPTGTPGVAIFTPKNVKGPVTITATAGGQTFTKQLVVYTSAADLVQGKGDWMMWRDWHNYNVNDTINRLKAAGVTHVYLEVSTTSDGFYGQDALDDFLGKAHDAGIAVLGWIYAALNDPWKDASQTVDVIRYTTPSGDQIDGLAADLEENLSAYNIEQFSKGIRDNFGPYYPMIAVVYPATWRPNLPWDVLAKYYDVMAPMVYWHYQERPYTYTDAYNAIKNEILTMHAKAGDDKPIHIIGQSYNMFDSWQYPTADEIKGAMQAAKDYGAVGYSTYRGRTATDYEWNQFASFSW